MSVHAGRASTVVGVAAVVALSFATPAVASPIPVGPNQFFIGVVNDATTDARIDVVCNPSGKSGHPLAGQSVAVLPASGSATTPTGFTGATGKVIGVGLGATADPQPVLQLGVYQVRQPIPTSVVTPCGGSGVVSFIPAPASATSRPATVKVTFVSVVA